MTNKPNKKKSINNLKAVFAILISFVVRISLLIGIIFLFFLIDDFINPKNLYDVSIAKLTLGDIFKNLFYLLVIIVICVLPFILVVGETGNSIIKKMTDLLKIEEQEESCEFFSNCLFFLTSLILAIYLIYQFFFL